MCVCVQAKNLETEEVYIHAWTDVDRPDVNHNRVGNDRHPLFCVSPQVAWDHGKSRVRYLKCRCL